MEFSPAALRTYLPPHQNPAGTWWVALSGGLDSCVLLQALASLELPVVLRALHINHQISPNAGVWETHCAHLCANLGVPFTAVKVTVENTGRGIEDAARRARYQVFEDHLNAGDLLLTAHHADDQSETLLLRLMRGTGPKGLAAMARERSLGLGKLCRPLLSFSRAQLEAYARAQALGWVDDESNADNHYDRNFLRNQVIPLLRERWPGFTAKWQETAELCAANEELIEELAAQDLARAQLQSEPVGQSISLAALEALSPARRHNLLRHWLREMGLSIPEQQHLAQVEQQLIAGRQDAEGQVNFGDVSLRTYRNRFFVLPLAALPSNPPAGSVAISVSQANHLPTGAVLAFELIESSGLALLLPELGPLEARFRQGGERCKPAGRAHSQTLKRLLQEYSVAPWLRESLPLIYCDNQLVAVADLWICEGYQAREKGYRLRYCLGND